MALYATNRFAGDGTTTSYEFNFVGKYIARTHVKVYQEDNATKVRTPVSINDSNFLNDTTLRGLPVTPVGSTLIIYRETPKPPLVDFVNGSRLTEYNLNLVARQCLFVAMEAQDAANEDAHRQLLDAIAVVVGRSAGAEAAARAAASSAADARGFRDAAQQALNGTVRTSGDQAISGFKAFADPLSVSGSLVLSGTRVSQNAYSIGFEFGPGSGTGNTNTQGFYVGPGKTLWFGANAGGGTMTLGGNGNFTASGNVTAYSDIRLKTALTKITDALSKVSRLNGYTYTRKDTGEPQTGVVAQEVQKVLPEAVVDTGEHLAVAYGNMVGLLIEAIKELKSDVDQLKGEVMAIKPSGSLSLADIPKPKEPMNDKLTDLM